MNNTFTVGNAIADGGDGYIYVLGSFGAHGDAMLARIAAGAFSALDWSQLLYWTAGGAWAPFSAALQPASLFAFMPRT